MSQLSPKYDPQSVEEKIYQQWEKSGAFQPKGKGKPYIIMLPPPNITGRLHMGHALQDTIMDALVRYHRMKGEPVLWLPGTDHAALPTNKIMVDQLRAEGKTPADIGREAFLARAKDWYEKTGAEILNQMKRLGASCDWSRSRFTMDEAYYKAVQETFIRYFERGYIYRGARIVNWDPAAKTTVSDLEIEYVAEKAPYYYFQYGPFEISTARPETKFADKYVVMHPDDTRYAKYKHGETFTAEWINGPITATIIKDEASDPNVGSGVMTITPWHSVIDFEIAQRHKLNMEPIIDFNGCLLPVAGEFAGLTIAEARPKIVEKLQQKGLVVKIDEQYEHNIALNDRGKGVLEPQVMRQWFVDMGKLKEETIAVANDELVTFVPPRWKKHFLTWMNNVRDWNINRQIWLGHRIPVWWKAGTHGTDQEENNFVVALEKPAGDYEQDPDVLDTWFSSALWPFATLGWPEATADLATYYPTSVLVTGRDILYLWVARMMFSGLELMKGESYGNRDVPQRIPFQEVFIHPTVLTKEGKRMSKSLGTGIDPLELMDAHGADATRFGLMSQMSYDSQAIKFDEADVKAGRNFANKLWNIARLLSADTLSAGEPSVADQWIEGRYNEVRDEYYRAFDEYKIGEAARLIYGFIWNDFADWYLEILKHEGSSAVARSIFSDLLKLLHPLMPYVTEALWEKWGGTSEDMLIAAPLAERRATTSEHAQAEAAMKRFQDIVTTVRSARVLLDIPVKAEIILAAEDAILPQALAVLTKAQLVADAPAGGQQLPLAHGGYITMASQHITPQSLEQGKQRLEKKLTELTQYLERLTATIERMGDKAPADVVEAKKAQVLQVTAQLAEVQRSRDALP
jgi:valyl-tRNA synthetase